MEEPEAELPPERACRGTYGRASRSFSRPFPERERERDLDRRFLLDPCRLCSLFRRVCLPSRSRPSPSAILAFELPCREGSGRQLASKIKIKIKTLNPMRYGSRGEEDLEDGGSKLLPASPSDMSTKSSSNFQAEPAP